MRYKVVGMDPDYVINMDQTPIPHSYHALHTLEKKGVKTVHARSSTADKKHATLAATVSGSGKLLHPMLIFKGKAGGQIEKNEFKTYPQECIYTCQPKAWIDESMMILWINEVLIPWKHTKDPTIVPLLILDAYRIHMMGIIVNHIHALGIEVQHLPGSCMYLCQSVGVGVNKPIKKEMTTQREDLMTEGDEMTAGVANKPTRKLLTEWIVGAYKNVSKEVGRNAWKKNGFEWVVG